MTAFAQVLSEIDLLSDVHLAEFIAEIVRRKHKEIDKPEFSNSILKICGLVCVKRFGFFQAAAQ